MMRLEKYEQRSSPMQFALYRRQTPLMIHFVAVPSAGKYERGSRLYSLSKEEWTRDGSVYLEAVVRSSIGDLSGSYREDFGSVLTGDCHDEKLPSIFLYPHDAKSIVAEIGHYERTKAPSLRQFGEYYQVNIDQPAELLELFDLCYDFRWDFDEIKTTMFLEIYAMPGGDLFWVFDSSVDWPPESSTTRIKMLLPRDVAIKWNREELRSGLLEVVHRSLNYDANKNKKPILSSTTPYDVGADKGMLVVIARLESTPPNSVTVVGFNRDRTDGETLWTGRFRHLSLDLDPKAFADGVLESIAECEVE